MEANLYRSIEQLLLQPSWVSEAGSVSDNQPWFIEDSDTARSKLWDEDINFNRTQDPSTAFHIIRDEEPGDNELIREDNWSELHGFVCEIEQRCGENGLAGVCDVNNIINVIPVHCSVSRAPVPTLITSAIQASSV